MRAVNLNIQKHPKCHCTKKATQFENQTPTKTKIKKLRHKQDAWVKAKKLYVNHHNPEGAV